MSLDVAKLTALLASISSFNTTLRSRLETKLEATAQAVDSARLEGKTLQEILTGLDAATVTQLNALSADLTAFMARQDNPHNVTAAQVGLGDVPNYAAATEAEAVAGVAADKLVTPAALGAFWADKIGTAPATLDTIQEIATALQNNPDVIAALQSLVQENANDIAAMQLLLDTKLGLTGLDLVAEGADKVRFVSGLPGDVGNVTLVTGVAEARALGITADLLADDLATGVLTIASGKVAGAVVVSRKFVAQADGSTVTFEQVSDNVGGWAAWSRVMRTSDQSSDAATLEGHGADYFATAAQAQAIQADHEAGFQSLVDEMNLLAAGIETPVV